MLWVLVTLTRKNQQTTLLIAVHIGANPIRTESPTFMTPVRLQVNLIIWSRLTYTKAPHEWRQLPWKEIRLFDFLPASIYLCLDVKHNENSRMSYIDLCTWIWACWLTCDTHCNFGWSVSEEKLSALRSLRSKDDNPFAHWCAPWAHHYKVAAIRAYTRTKWVKKEGRVIEWLIE